MEFRIRIAIVVGGALSTAVASYFFLRPDVQLASDVPPYTQSVTRIDSGDSEGASQSLESQESLEAVMSHPNVVRYLQREARKESLQRYFSDLSTDSGAEAWRLIDEIERDGGMLAYEALALKLAWLERNSADRAAFDQAAAELLDTYRQRAERARAAYDPYRDVPGFSAYKSMERQIVEEVQGMEQIPNGMRRDEYLRMRLQEARELAYGR